MITKRVDVNGLGVWIEVYSRNPEYSVQEMLHQAEKAIRRELIKYEKVIGTIGEGTNERAIEPNSGC